MFCNDRQYPLRVGLQYLVEKYGRVRPVARWRRKPGTQAELAIATLLAIAPVFIVFLFAQHALVTGMPAGATKG